MIIGIGIDTASIDRFSHWHCYSQKRLSRIFTQEEWRYCIANPSKMTERFAGRFAIKEASFKALSPFNKRFSFLALAKHLATQNLPCGALKLTLPWDLLSLPFEKRSINTHVSLTHEKNLATALVILERFIIF